VWPSSATNSHGIEGGPPVGPRLVSVDTFTPGLLNPQCPDADPVTLTLQRPATGRTQTVTIMPALFPATASLAWRRPDAHG
jgi:hypothetical protein